MIEQEQEQAKACRQAHWSEIDYLEKIERIRREVKRLQAQVVSLSKLVNKLEEHRHQEGQLVVPLKQEHHYEGRIDYERETHVYF